jgi:hypothetical protein
VNHPFKRNVTAAIKFLESYAIAVVKKVSYSVPLFPLLERGTPGDGEPLETGAASPPLKV